MVSSRERLSTRCSTGHVHPYAAGHFHAYTDRHGHADRAPYWAVTPSTFQGAILSAARCQMVFSRNPTAGQCAAALSSGIVPHRLLPTHV